MTQELTDEVITSSMIVSFHAALAVGERYRCGVLSSVDAKVEIQRHGVGIAVQGGHRCRLHGLQVATWTTMAMIVRSDHARLTQCG